VVSTTALVTAIVVVKLPKGARLVTMRIPALFHAHHRPS
jgi:hypothetical protein